MGCSSPPQNVEPSCAYAKGHKLRVITYYYLVHIVNNDNRQYAWSITLMTGVLRYFSFYAIYRKISICCEL